MAIVKKTRRSVLPLYAAAAVWPAWALLRPLYRLGDFLLVSVLSLGAFLLLRAVCKDEVVEVEVPDPPREEEKPTGDPALDRMIEDGRKAISEMKRLDGAIEDEKISADIRRLEAVCQKIFDQVRADPSKLPQIRQFMDYYLPTTLKLLNAYDRMDDAGISGENIDSTKAKVEKTMAILVTAFDRQLDALFGDEALDVATDIKVIETLLSREGLVGDQPFAQAGETKPGEEIELTLDPQKGEENHE